MANDAWHVRFLSTQSSDSAIRDFKALEMREAGFDDATIRSDLNYYSVDDARKSIQRARRRGMPIRSPFDFVVFRFWSHVDQRGPNECWPWTASIQKSGFVGFGVGEMLRDDGTPGKSTVTALSNAAIAPSLLLGRVGNRQSSRCLQECAGPSIWPARNVQLVRSSSIRTGIE